MADGFRLRFPDWVILDRDVEGWGFWEWRIEGWGFTNFFIAEVYGYLECSVHCGFTYDSSSAKKYR